MISLRKTLVFVKIMWFRLEKHRFFHEKAQKKLEKADETTRFADFRCLGIPKSAKTLGFTSFFKLVCYFLCLGRLEEVGETKRFG